MMKWMLAAGAAALAVTAPSAAERGGGKGGGKQEQSAQAQKAERGGGQKAGGQRRGGDRQARTERSGGNREARSARTERGGGGNREIRSARTERGGDRARQLRFAQDDRTRGRNEARTEKRGGDRARAPRADDVRGRGRDDIRTVRIDRGGDVLPGRGNRRVADADRIFRAREVDKGVVRFRDVDRDDLFVRQLGYGVGGCPPGLAKKPVACMPPGQAAKFVGQPLSAAARLGALGPLPRSLSSLYWDDDDHYYRWGGGYLYRVDRDDALISSMIPLFGAALLGQPLQPSYMNNYYRPSYFNSFYPNSPYDCYRYGYGYVYETDCASGLVEDVIPTYDYGYGVGQMLPASYGYYNVPFQYRSHFVDDDDYFYRYAPGSIYRVDRDTALISAVVALLTNGLSVGQPLPTGYSAYNVPLAYRSTYYDTPDAWYRYDNGYIYAVDPGSRMVRNVVYVV
jgi:hypothetical protein